MSHKTKLNMSLKEWLLNKYEIKSISIMKYIYRIEMSEIFLEQIEIN